MRRRQGSRWVRALPVPKNRRSGGFTEIVATMASNESGEQGGKGQRPAAAGGEGRWAVGGSDVDMFIGEKKAG